MEPCAHHGTTPPCVDAIRAAGVARVVAGSLDPNPEAQGGFERLRRRAPRSSSTTASRRGSRTRRGARGLSRSSPFVTYKAAVTLDGRVTVPGERWVSGEESRRSCTSCAPPRTRSRSGWGRCGSRTHVSMPATSARHASRVGSHSAADRSRRFRARAPQRPARGGAPLARDRGRPVALARGRPHTRRRVPRGRARRQAAPLRRTDALRRRPARRARSRESASALQLTSRQVGDDVLLEAYLREP